MKYFLYLILLFQFEINAQNCSYWSTYFGNLGSDEIKGIAIDNNKNSYIIAETSSASLTITPGLISDTLVGSYDAYIAKFDSCGNFIWGTYLGTTAFESGEKILVCQDGNIAFTGYSQGSSLPTTTACFQPTNSGQYDCFLGKITPNGNLIWLTYFGKSGSEFAYDLSSDFNGNLFIGGTTTSTNLYTNASSFQQTFGGNTDAFIAKFSKNGIFKWCTYYGGLASEDIHVLANDAFGNVYGSGGTISFNLSTSPGCIQPSKDNVFDCYIIKLDSIGNRIFSTYLGGNGQDDSWGLVADNSGNIFLSGQTTSSNFTMTPGAYQSAIVGMADMFLVKISPAGNLLYSTFIGGSDADAVNRTKILNNEVYILGTTASTNFPMLGTSNYSVLPGALNLIIVRFNLAGQPNYSTYYGSVGGYDYGNDLAVTPTDLFFTGKTSSGTYPVTASCFQNNYAGNDDGIITRIQNNDANLITALKTQQNSDQQIFLFPNPTREKLNIKTSNPLKNKLKILNCFGQVIKEVKIEDSNLDVTDLAEGIYFLRIEDRSYKFIKAN